MKIQINFCTLKKSDLYLMKIQITFVKKIKFAFNESGGGRDADGKIEGCFNI